jgi:hypothetical protein
MQNAKCKMQNAKCKMQNANVFKTFAGITIIEKEIGFKPQAKLLGRIIDFADGFRNYY